MTPRHLKLKFYIGISGHRNLKISEIHEYKGQIKQELEKIVKENLDKEVMILSPLADGADRLMVYAAKEIGLRYEILLPMPIEYYELDFDDESFDEFYQLFIEARCSDVVELYQGNTYGSISEYGDKRDQQYQKMGREIVDKSDMMIFLWDKKENNLMGGTSDIFNYAEERNKSLLVIECERE